MLLFPPVAIKGHFMFYTCINQLEYKGGVQKSLFKTLTEKGENIYKPDFWEEISIESREETSVKCVSSKRSKGFTQTLQVVCSLMSTPVTHSSRTISFLLSSASPVEGFGEETGGGAEPAATGIFFSVGAGDCFVHVLLWDLVLLWEVAGDGSVVLHFHSRWVQRDKNLKHSILEQRCLDFSLFYLHVDTKMVES